MNKKIKSVDRASIDERQFTHCYVSCIVLTHDKKILLQQRGNDWPTFPGLISTFGGRIELEENALHALIRELKEELGADVIGTDVVSFGAYTEAVTDHKELVYGYFWHDRQRTITGCYEGEAKYFDSVKSVLACPNTIDDVRWLLKACQKRGLLKEKKKQRLSQKIATLSGNVVSKKGHVSAIDLFLELGWLTQNHLADWRTGKIPYLELVLTANLSKLTNAMKEFKSWAIHAKLKASTTIYKHKNSKLRFSKSGNLTIENAYNTHYVLIKSEKNKVA